MIGGIGLWLCVTAGLVALSEHHAAQLEGAAISEGFARADAASESLRQALLRVVEGVDVLLGIALTRVRIAAIDTAGARILDQRAATLVRDGRVGVRAVSFFGLDGVAQWSTLAEVAGITMTDPAIIRRHAEGERDMSVSARVTGRVDGRDLLIFSRPLLDDQGQLEGVAVVAVDPAVLGNLVSQLLGRLGDGVTAFRRRDGMILASAPRFMASSLLAVPDRPHPVYMAALERESGQLVFRGIFSDRDRLGAFRVLPVPGIVAAYGVDRALQLEEVAGAIAAVRMACGAASLALAATLIGAFVLRARRDIALSLEAERARAQIAELARNEFLRVHAGVPAVIFHGTMGPDGRYTRRSLSPSIEAVTGWPVAAVNGFEFWSQTCDPPDAMTDLRWRQVLLDQGEATKEFRLRRPDGRWMWVRSMIRVIERTPDGGGEVVGFLSDITRERELTAQAAATAKLATLGEMATGIAHELNQPIAVMTLAAENIEFELEAAGPLAPGVKERLHRIMQQADRAKVIIDHLRLFGHPAEGPLLAIDLAAGLRGARLLTDMSLRSARIGLRVDLPEDLPPVQARLVALEQVLVNLILNARDAVAKLAPDQRREIAVVARAQGEWVTIDVSDTGGGIDPAVLPRLFEPFVTTKEAGVGTGLGLSICHGIIRSFGGDVSGRNAARGAVFTIRLRVANNSPVAVAA